MSNVLLRAQDVHKTYLLGKVPLRVLRGVNVDVRAGELLAAGRTAVREATLEASWGLVARDGLDAADVVVHGALDLYALEDLDLPDDARSRAFERLAALPATTARERLAERFGS